MPDQLLQSALLDHPKGSYDAASARLPHVLTAEDNDDLRAVMRAILELHGFTVTACADAEEAEAVFFAQGSFDLLLTDLEMPGKSGAVLAEILSRKKPSMPVLIISGANVSERELLDYSSKGWSFMNKPFSIPHLIDQIRSLISGAVPVPFSG
ncbi:MAG: response regulator [Janthinobacterium lividum]